jgi:hypothetical protein
VAEFLARESSNDESRFGLTRANRSERRQSGRAKATTSWRRAERTKMEDAKAILTTGVTEMTRLRAALCDFNSISRSTTSISTDGIGIKRNP